MRRFFALFALLTVLHACDRDDSGLEYLQLSTDPIVFEDEFDLVIFEPFANAFLTAVSVADQETYGGSEGSVRIEVQPASEGPYSGGAFTAFVARDLSGYNVLRMQIKASAPASLDLIGIGEGNTGASLYQASMKKIALTTEWQELLIPVPRPSRLKAERGMMYFADEITRNVDPAAGYIIWIDQIEWAKVGDVELVAAQVPDGTTNAILGEMIVFEPRGLRPSVQIDVQGTRRNLECRSWYFDYYDAAWNPTTPPVIEFDRGVARVVNNGTAEVRARIEGIEATGTLVVTAVARPGQRAPIPTYAASNVRSIFSDRYEDSEAVNFRPEFGAGDFSKISVQGDEVLAYTGITFGDIISIDFASELIDATNYTHLRVDAWLPVGTEGDTTDPLLATRLVDFGADGEFSGDPFPQGDDTLGALGFGFTKAFPSEQWVTFEIPLDDFESSTPSTGTHLGSVLSSRTNLAQIGFQANGGYLFLDNLLFFRAPNAD